MKELLVLRSKTILLVEDNETTRKHTADMLTLLFGRVVTARNGVEAFETYIDERPDIVLSDIKMPDMDGIELITAIRERDESIPIVLFSAHGDQKYLLKAINLGVDAYAIKPVKFEDLLQIFAKCAKKFSAHTTLCVQFKNGVRYDAATNTITCNGEISLLSPKERDVLGLLIAKSPNILTKKELTQTLWPNDAISDSAMKNIIARLRAKVGAESIVTISGIGWRVVLDELP